MDLTRTCTSKCRYHSSKRPLSHEHAPISFPVGVPHSIQALDEGLEAMEKEIRANGEKWLKEEKEMTEKMQAEAMSSMKTGFMGWFGPSAADQQQQQQEAKK